MTAKGQQRFPLHPSLFTAYTVLFPYDANYQFLGFRVSAYRLAPQRVRAGVAQEARPPRSEPRFVDTLPETDRFPRASGIQSFELLDASSIEFGPERRYEVVASYGLVEHCEATTEAIRGRVAFLARGSGVAVETPNLHYGQRLPMHACYLAWVKTHILSSDRGGLRRTWRTRDDGSSAGDTWEGSDLRFRLFLGEPAI